MTAQTHSDSAGFPLGHALLRALARNWWLVLLRGFAAIALGVLAFIWPKATLLTLVWLWGIYALVDGVFALGAAIGGGAGTMAPRWWLALTGIAGLVAGVLAFVWPDVTGLVLLTFLAVWAIFTGIMQIIGAIALRKQIEGEWFLVLGGLLSVGFGAMLIAQPRIGAVVLAWTIGWFALLFGVAQIALALRLRKLNKAL